MTAEFNITFADFREAQRAHLSAQMKNTGRGARWLLRIITAAVFIAIAVLVLSLSGAIGSRGALLLSLTIGALLFLGTLLTIVRAIAAMRGAREQPIEQFIKPRATLEPLQVAKGLAGWVLFIALAVFLYRLLEMPSSTPATATTAGSPPPAP